MISMTERYEIRVRGLLGPLLRVIFGGMTCESVPCQSTIHGDLTDDDLRRLLERLDQSGVELVELSRAAG
jgi:hypothetical protein